MVRTPISPKLPFLALRALKPAKIYLSGLKSTLGSVRVPFDCCLCKEPCESGGLCRVCSKLLYLNDNFCLRCAYPLAMGSADAARSVNESTNPGCENCHLANFPWRRAIVPVRYCFPLDLLVIRFKYQEDMVVGRALGQILGLQIAKYLQEHPDPPLAMVPIPLEAGKMQRRGFNQSLELARAAATVCGLPVWSGVLVRERPLEPINTGRQNIRSRNLRMHANASGFPVLLIDDVMTTGSTLKGAAEALLQAGAPAVDVAAVGRTVDYFG